MSEKTDRLWAELKAAEAEEAAERKAQREAVKISYRYDILPAMHNRWDRIYDSTCTLYKLARTTVNADEAKAAGHPEYDLRDGYAIYLYNKANHRIVCSVGGGTMYISSRLGSPDDAADIIAFSEIGMFLADHPEGGDITGIVERYRALRRR